MQCYYVLISTDDVMQSTYCEIDLDKPTRDAFVYAIKNHYWYQMYIDDLPIWGKTFFTYTVSAKLRSVLLSSISNPSVRIFFLPIKPYSQLPVSCP